MKNWKVIVPPSVWGLIRDQARYIAKRSPGNARVWAARLDVAIYALADMPGLAVDEEATERLGYTVHKLVFEGTYLVHYRLDEPAGELHVVGFRHGARLPREGEP